MDPFFHAWGLLPSAISASVVLMVMLVSVSMIVLSVILAISMLVISLIFTEAVPSALATSLIVLGFV